jgi:hypothetical protein
MSAADGYGKTGTPSSAAQYVDCFYTAAKLVGLLSNPGKINFFVLFNFVQFMVI